MLDFIKNSWAENNKKLDVAIKKLLDKRAVVLTILTYLKFRLTLL